jgi:hypothetical protein
MTIRKLAVMAMVALVVAALAAMPAFAGSEKVTVCHQGENELVIGDAALQSHLDHGDTAGACGVVTPPPADTGGGQYGSDGDDFSFEDGGTVTP